MRGRAAALLVLLVSGPSGAETVIADFSRAAEISRWTGVHDQVMGGVSEAGLVPAGEHASFTGTVSTDFGGGFASLRRAPAALNLGRARSLTLEVRGDGKTYQLRLKPGNRLDGVAWRALFTPGPQWQTLTLPFDGFEPVFRGRPVPEAGPLDPGAVRQVGLMIAGGQAGPFRLDIRSITVPGDSSP